MSGDEEQQVFVAELDADQLRGTGHVLLVDDACDPDEITVDRLARFVERAIDDASPPADVIPVDLRYRASTTF